jgi:hypothetical protein
MVPIGGLIVSLVIVVALAELNASSLTVFAAAIVCTLGTMALAIAVLPAFVLTSLRSIDNKSAGVEEMWRAGQPFVFKYLLLTLLLGVLFVAGAALFLLPYVWLYKRYMMAPYYLVNENVGPIEAMRRSARDSKRFTGAMWGVVGITVLIELLYTLPHVGRILGTVFIVLYSGAPIVRYNQIRDIKAKDPKPKKVRSKKPSAAKAATKRGSGKSSTFAKQFDR